MIANSAEKEIIKKQKLNIKWLKAKKMKLLYLFLLFPVAHIFIFNYLPMYGIQIAFKDFVIGEGIFASKWNNFQHFKFIFGSSGFITVLLNTLRITGLRILFGFPAPIILALLLNEITHLRFKKTVQTISYLPHFLSWVVLAGIFLEVFSPQRGIFNYFLSLFGIEPINFLIDNRFFIPIIITTGIWQGVGWGAIIYLASLASINPELYESANLDGANRFQKAIYISVPSLIPVITILWILGLSGILNAGFDQIFNMYSPLVYDTADIIDTYVYRMGLQQLQYDFSTAVGVFKNVAGLLLIIFTNIIARRFTEYAVW